ncbi:mannosyltransferase [Spathaspora passalidarum NRRL Y-27907]|uniref:Mannosyltransferase n=1 Tax=Spathaspora passalidarum (strain NRRL Y-27907 / 11-Y1) TaxID=619300 RepID=G3AKZ7_SPAPN|nr:mannosyltransferase [Spathaspora passalidarum NRRL Y-27907]EGW33040.1 mannosyltransferase [Spathaspora passalidarum NRRL Y-27907]
MIRHTFILGIILAVYYYYSVEYFENRSKSQLLQSIEFPSYNPLEKHAPKLASNSYLDVKYPKGARQQIGKENATLVMLCRNSELEGALKSMRSLEDRFNRHYKYPWVFLNEVPFSDEFIEKTTLMASGKVYHELIPEEDWEAPKFINETKLQESLDSSHHIIYGSYRSYRNMCHFNSGYFYRQKRLLDYEWYFRVEPDVEYMCDFQYDPFELLRTTNKMYGFIVTFLEYENTIPTLWPTVESFMKENPDLIHPNNSLDFITTHENSLNSYIDLIPSSSDYNLCHFWSNFEIANLNFFRSEAYGRYFDYLDKSGGFYYERWGDAPVHTIGLSILLDKNQIHHFEDIGYYHAPYLSCPGSGEVRASKRCICEPRTSEKIKKPIDVDVYSCLPRWWKYGGGKRFLNEIDYIR